MPPSLASDWHPLEPAAVAQLAFLVRQEAALALKSLVQAMGP